MEFYAAMKKNEMLSFASKWMGNTTRGFDLDHMIK
jgi:hypothetical protein